MGWSTNLFCNIEFYKQTFNTHYEVECKLEETNNLIKLNENVLKELTIITEPDKFFTLEEGEDAIDRIRLMFKEALEELNDLYVEKYKLELLLENWETCHDEQHYAIEPPENINYDSAFLSGDFIKSKNRTTIYD